MTLSKEQLQAHIEMLENELKQLRKSYEWVCARLEQLDDRTNE